MYSLIFVLFLSYYTPSYFFKHLLFILNLFILYLLYYVIYGLGSSKSVFGHSLSIGSIIGVFCEGLKEQIESRTYFYKNSKLVRGDAAV